MSKIKHIITCKVQLLSQEKTISFDEQKNMFIFKYKAERCNGKANKKLIELISKKLKIPLYHIGIISGFTTTIKRVSIISDDTYLDLQKKLIT